MLIKILVNVQIFCKFLLQYRLLALFFASMCATLSYAEPYAVTTERIDENTYHFTAQFNCTPPDFMYYDYLTFFIDSPEITITHWHASIEPTMQYDIVFKQSKKIFKEPFNVHVYAHTPTGTLPAAYLHITYFQHSHKKMQYALFAIGNTQKTEQISISTQAQPVTPTAENLHNNSVQQNSPAPISPYLLYFTMHAQSLYLFFIFILALMYGSFIWLCIRKTTLFWRRRIQNPRQQFCIIAVSFMPCIVFIYCPAHITYRVTATLAFCLAALYLHILRTCSQHTFKQRCVVLLATICCMAMACASVVLCAYAWKKAYIMSYNQNIYL